MMDALGLGTFFAVVALLALLALLLLAGWWWLRRDVSQPAASWTRGGGEITRAEERNGADDAEAGTGEAPPGRRAIEVPDRHELMRRLHALAFEGAAAVEPLPAELLEHEAIAAATANLLSRAEFSARHLPRQPQLLPKLVQAINNPNASLDQIAKIIGEDPALSANLLRIANSPFYRVRKKPVEGLLRAAAMLGMDGLRPVVAAALVQPVIPGGKTTLGKLQLLLWEHTQQSAGIASELARELGSQEDAFAAQMLGLLHGLGAVVVVQVLRDQYALYPQLRPYSAILSAMLDQQAVPMAQRIAASWDQSERIGGALAALQREELPDDVLGRALGTGHVAAALAMLCRQGQLGRGTGLAMLQAWAGAHGVHTDLERLWGRLQG